MIDRFLLITLGSLLVITFIDLFHLWYVRFLEKRMPDLLLRRRLRQLVWAMLAVSFWTALRLVATPDQHSFLTFLFVLFIYSVRGLIFSFLPSRWRVVARAE